MPIIQFLFDKMSFDSKKYIDELNKIVETVFREAAKEFFRVAASRIPVRTGFVRGAFGVDAKGQLFKSNRKSRAKIVEYYYPPFGGKVGKTPTSGRQFATTIKDQIKTDGKKIQFQFDVDITYFKIQDVKNIGRSRSAPWLAMQSGKLAFQAYIEKNLKLPDIGHFISIRKVIV